MSQANKQDIRFDCADKYSLSGSVFIPATAPKAAIMLAPATGIKLGV